MAALKGKGIVISNFAGIYRAQIVDFDRGGIPERISMTFVNRKQADQIAVDWHLETGYPIYEKN